MSETPGDAPLAEFWREEIPRLAVLYDRFAHALDPFDPGVDLAEQTFNGELASLFDTLSAPKPEFRSFRRHVIALCRAHLRAGDRPSSV
jgi:hypothetical protein